MARLNSVTLYGCVADPPRITKKQDGDAQTFVRGIFHLAVIRGSRYSGETFGEKDRILYDWPIILSTDPEIISKMNKLRQYDIVQISGVFVTRKIKKITYCKTCGEKNEVEGNITFVLPIFMERRNTEKEPYTENQAIQEIIKNRPISNVIHILGNLCNDVTYFRQDKIETCTYQIATDRRYFIKDDALEIKTDFPIVRSYGKVARQDQLCIHKGSLVLIDGFLHSREFDRKTVCGACSSEYMWKDNILEIVPYATEYLANYTDPETAEAEREKQIAEEGLRLAQTLF